jgi:hypothetical protein
VDVAVETADADWMATQASERPPTARRLEPEPEPEPEPQPEEASAEQEEKPAPQKRVAKKTRGRASVPSWDEIMFGGGRSE